MCHFHFCLDFRLRHTSWHVRDWVSITLQRKPDVEIVEVLEHTASTHTAAATHAHSQTHTHRATRTHSPKLLSSGSNQRRHHEAKRNAAWQQRQGNCHGYRTHCVAAAFSNGRSEGSWVRRKGARFKCAQSQLNWSSNDSIYALANLQLRLKCVCV